MVRDVLQVLQNEEYPRAEGKKESISAPQTLLPLITFTYCITGLLLRIGSSRTRMIKPWKCLNVYNVFSKCADR